MYPLYFAYEWQNNVTLNLDVLDSNFQKLDGTTANCTFDMVNSQGGSVASGNVIYDTVNKYWYYTIDDTLINIGTYNYYVYCSSATEYGYLSQVIEITGDGQQIHEDLAPVAVIIFIPIALAFLLLYAITVVGTGHAALKIFMFLLSFISVSVSYNYAVLAISTFYATTSFAEFVASDYTWYGWVIYIFIIYFILYWIIQFTVGVNSRKQKELTFEDGNGGGFR